MIKIKEIKIREILNSVGKKAVEVEIRTYNNIRAISSSPSAIIPGKREVVTTNEVNENKLNEMINEICDRKLENQEEFDSILDNYMRELGSNICLPFSLAFARVMAQVQNLTLVEYIEKVANYKKQRKSPIPLIAIFSGGVHNQKEKGSIQNIMLAVDIHPFSKAIPAITDIYSYIENELKKKDILKAYGQSSGMIVEEITIDEKFKMVSDTIKTLNYENEVSIAIDVAAEHFFKGDIYIYQGKAMKSQELNDILNQYNKKYNITYIEDPFDSKDEEYWKKMKSEHKAISIVGDDLFATQDKYINNELANGIIIKMNQVGTLTGVITAFCKAKKENMTTCVSQRSIETEDTFMCDLAVALNATYIKIGGPRRGDRIAKYNRLLRLEEQEKETI
ncbi:MAG: hypothetical protein HFH31_00010 [Bacilli bacterium]|nr:hypothetical protein [Bacilli bacterium]